MTTVSGGQLLRAPAVVRARELADELLRPAAEQVDASLVPRSHVDAWGRAGLLGLSGPPRFGGGGAPVPVLREVTEVLAGACGATWFVLTQHASPLAVLAGSGNDALQDRLLPGMCDGTVLAGIAVAHLRRPGPPPVTATRTGAGWRFDGHVGWMTGWGICDRLLLWGVTPDSRAVAAFVPAREQAGLTASAPMALAAMQATQTVTLELDALQVPDRDVADVLRLADWRRADTHMTANAGAHTFGLQRECVRRLEQLAARRSDATAAALAVQLDNEGERLRRIAWTFVDDVPAGEHLEDRLAVRAAALELTMRTATALVSASGGAGMASSAAPQRLAREALFGLVQAQTPPVQEATLQLFRDAS